MVTPVQELDLPEVDLDPTADRRQIRQQMAADGHWLFRTQIGYLVTTYDDVVAILRDQRWHSAAAAVSESNIEVGIDDDFDRWRAARPLNLLHAEGDDHRRLRAAMMPFFTGAAIEDRRASVRATAAELLAPMVERGEGEFVTEVCRPYPELVMFDLLDTGPDDLTAFRELADAAEVARSRRTKDPAQIMADTERFDRFAEGLLDRAGGPTEWGSGLVAALAGLVANGELERGEARSLVQTALVAGTESTRSQLAAAVSLLARHPEQYQRLRAEPELAASAAEEAMRCLGAVRGTARIASVDIDHHDVGFPAGTAIIVNFSAGNRDAGRFDEPNRFDIGRANAGQHLTFGHGIHYCVGAQLARVELSEMLTELAATVATIEIGGDVAWGLPTSDFWGPTSLPLRFG